MFPRPSSATDATKRQSRHTGGLSIVFDVAEKKLCVCVMCVCHLWVEISILRCM